MHLDPTNIQQIGEELAIAWNDGTESYLKLEMLRRACPCAACGGEPDVLRAGQMGMRLEFTALLICGVWEMLMGERWATTL